MGCGSLPLILNTKPWGWPTTSTQGFALSG